MIKKLFLGFVFSMVAVLPFASGQISAATPDVKEDAVAWWGGHHGWGGYRGGWGYGSGWGYGYNNYNYYPYSNYSNYSYDCPSCYNYY